MCTPRPVRTSTFQDVLEVLTPLSALSMTFGRPCTIPESYVKLNMPVTDIQMLISAPKANYQSQLDGLFFTAAM
jgi:hypothetical protein